MKLPDFFVVWIATAGISLLAIGVFWLTAVGVAFLFSLHWTLGLAGPVVLFTGLYAAAATLDD